MTTIGYGDLYVISYIGKLIIFLLIMAGMTIITLMVYGS